MKISKSSFSEYFYLAGFRYWTASILPAITGLTLPFWLDPPDFEFRIFESILFLIATITCHAGFSFLYYGVQNQHRLKWRKSKLLLFGIIHLIATILIGLYLNRQLHLNSKVPSYIFIVYGVSVIFTGILYVAPPFYLSRRVFGEFVLSVGLGLLPVLGAYILQAGDITRTVYLASLPLVISTGLWNWIIELVKKETYENSGYKTTAMLFPFPISCRVITPILIFALYTSLFLAVFGRSSLSPFSLAALVSLFFAWKIVRKAWKNEEIIDHLKIAGKYACLIHLTVGVGIIMSSFSTLF